MKNKSVAVLCAWAVASIVGWGLAPPSLAQEASTSSILKKFRGDWACSFQAPSSAFGLLIGVELIQIDRAGNISGRETVAGSDPFLELQTTFTGKFVPQPNGMVQAELTLHIVDPPGQPDQTFVIICDGMDPQGDHYRELRCLDIFSGPDGTHFLGSLTCKSQ